MYCLAIHHSEATVKISSIFRVCAPMHCIIFPEKGELDIPLLGGTVHRYQVGFIYHISMSRLKSLANNIQDWVDI
jgi:hypothetical protein